MARRREIAPNTKGFTLIELLIVVAIIGIVAGIALPGLIRARMSGNEASAIGSIRAINSSQISFAESCGGGGFATSLAALATNPNAGGGPFISVDLATNPSVKSGYTILLAPGANVQPVLAAANTCNGTPSSSTYHGTATPVGVSTGTRSFATNNSGSIWQDFSGVAIPVVIPATAQILQ